MNVHLTPELEQLVHGKVKSGRYNSASEVIREALRIMEQKDEVRAIQLQELRARIDKGLGEANRGKGVDGEIFMKGLLEGLDAGAKKRIEGSVVGAADIMLFPNLLSANLTVKAIMYTADCKFGGVLRGTTAPVVFMSRADTTETRLNSLALMLRFLDH